MVFQVEYYVSVDLISTFNPSLVWQNWSKIRGWFSKAFDASKLHHFEKFFGAKIFVGEFDGFVSRCNDEWNAMFTPKRQILDKILSNYNPPKGRLQHKLKSWDKKCDAQ